MPDFGAYEAKTRLPKLLERVQQGERFVITKHGRPVAELVPAAARDAARIRETIAGMRERRAALVRLGVRLADILRPSETLRDLAQSGHRAQMAFVLDSSVALSWLLPDEDSGPVDALADRLEAESAEVPAI